MTRVLTVVAVIACSSVVARAQDDPPGRQQAEPTAQTADRHREILAEAITEYEAGHYVEARALFLRARELQPDARAERALGMTAFELRQYGEAYLALQSALTEERNPLTEEQREQTAALANRTRNFLGLFVVVTTPADAAIFVDDEPAMRAPDGTVVVQIGRHEITARAEGHRDASAEVEVRGGEEGNITLELASASATVLEASDVDEALTTAAAPAQVATADGGSSLPLVLLVAGGMLAAAAVASAIVWVRGRDDALDECDAGLPGMRCVNRDDLDGQRDLAFSVTLGLGIGGGVAVATGLITLAIDG